MRTRKNVNGGVEKTRSRSMKRMKKTQMNKEHLNENSERKKLLTKSTFRTGKAETRIKPGSTRRRLKEKREEKGQKKLND